MNLNSIKKIGQINKYIIEKRFLLYFSILILLVFFSPISGSTKSRYNLPNAKELKKNKLKKNYKLSNITWEKLEDNNFPKNKIRWESIDSDHYYLIKESFKKNIDFKKWHLKSLNRSIVFDNRVGPDIGWLVPPGLSWSENHKFDASVRGHNRRKKGEPFLGWNNGDAVGQIYLQPIHTQKSSYGVNLGVRSVYQGDAYIGGGTEIGEGLSIGFRYDRELSSTSGMAIGAEQLLHLDEKTDTGRDIYITFSKGWWRNKGQSYPFPLYTATAGFATGKMAEGTVNGLCSDLFGGSGTEIRAQRPLCWAPVFSLAKVFNESFSTFFEYNSYWFLLGTSYAPFESIPLRGTFAVQISDHTNNYEVNDFENLKWVFRVSLGF